MHLQLPAVFSNDVLSMITIIAVVVTPNPLTDFSNFQHLQDIRDDK